MSPLLFALAVASVTKSPAPAAHTDDDATSVPAVTNESTEDLAHAHAAHPAHGVSARMLAGGALIADEHVQLAGVGVAFEQDFADGALAVEGAAELLTEHDAGAGNAHDSAALLVELVVEKPIALTDHWGLYFGGGPALVGHFLKPGHVEPGFGALMLAGTEIELVEHWEVFVELDTAFLYLDHPVVEADLGAGVMWRF